MGRKKTITAIHQEMQKFNTCGNQFNLVYPPLGTNPLKGKFASCFEPSI
jgi:hypothetical protein